MLEIVTGIWNSSHRERHNLIRVEAGLFRQVVVDDFHNQRCDDSFPVSVLLELWHENFQIVASSEDTQ